MNILDLTIMKCPDFPSSGSVDVFLYRKPCFKPMYLASTSQHHTSCKSAIVNGELMRLLLANSTRAGYDSDVHTFCEHMKTRGYYVKPCRIRPYDSTLRARCLAKLASRNLAVLANKSSNGFVFVTTYFSHVYELELYKQWSALCDSFCVGNSIMSLGQLFKASSFRVAYRNDKSLFLKTYRLNQPG